MAESAAAESSDQTADSPAIGIDVRRHLFQFGRMVDRISPDRSGNASSPTIIGGYFSGSAGRRAGLKWDFGQGNYAEHHQSLGAKSRAARKCKRFP